MTPGDNPGMDGAMSNTIARRIEQLNERVSIYLGSHNLVVGDHEYVERHGFDEQLTAQALTDHARSFEDNKSNVLKLGQSLVSELERDGFNTTNLLRFLNLVGGHSGGPKTSRIWRDLWPSLQRYALRKQIAKSEMPSGGAARGRVNAGAKRKHVHLRPRKAPRVATRDMMAVHTAKKGGASFRAIAKDRKRRGLKGTSPQTISDWYNIAEAELNPKSRSKQVCQKLPEDRRGQSDVSRDRRLD